ncbi:MAG TPA: 16S rRNA (guanine(966)-N(2))-methyltransferase RsmD [Casimicrobiaceae bacterium]|nr:16S rRNA (guanine(966)-N(2))-methyltransferase RsmD [Casimicrobiaceae bacterium]
MPANALRIIGGRWRGRRLHFPRTPELRPTPDRVRETLFNWLGQDLTGRTTLDAFAGSGALSLEALSRGASLAVAVERDPSLVRALQTTATTLGARALETHCGDAWAFLARDQRRYDVVFLDPPFAADDWLRLLPAASARLAADGRLYVEARRPVDAPPGLTLLRSDKAGRVHYHLLARAQA